MTLSLFASAVTAPIIALTIGVLLGSLILPHRTGSHILTPFGFFIGGGLGIGVTSCLYFIGLLAGVAPFIPVVDLGMCIILGLLVLIRWRKGSLRTDAQPVDPAFPSRGQGAAAAAKFRLLTAGIFLLELVAFLISFAVTFLKEPHGRWDAWLIWNMHARFLFRSGETWRNVFASGLDWSHWDYPLLLPLSIARSWSYGGIEITYLPALVALLFTLLTLGLLVSALAFLKGKVEGYLAGMILLGTPLFITMGASQFADVPLAFFILATLALFFCSARSTEGPAGALILAGLAAGLAAWTKNEGLLFLLICTACLFIAAFFSAGWRGAMKQTLHFLAGALPVLIIVIYFKTSLAPANDLVAGSSMAALSAKLFDMDRYRQIVRAFFVTGISFTQGLIDLREGMRLNPGPVNILLLGAYLLLAGVKTDPRDRICLIQTGAVLLLMLGGYFFVYVVTPLDLIYHLFTSLNRLFLQLWPSVIFVVFLLAGAAEQASGKGLDGISPLPGKPARGKRQKG